MRNVIATQEDRVEREISIEAALALMQEELYQLQHPQPEPELPEHCRRVTDLKPGDQFLYSDRCLRDDDGQFVEVDGYCVSVYERVTVVRGAELNTTSDPFGREMQQIRVKSDRLGHEGNLTYGHGASVVVELDGSPYQVMREGLTR